MANDATNIAVGAGGQIYVAAAGSTLPTDALTAPDVAFADHGHITDDGVTEGNSKTTTDIFNWYGAVVRTITSGQTFTLAASFMETNPETLHTYYGDDSATATAWVVKAVQGRRGIWVVDAIDGDAVRRLVIPDGQITDTGDIDSSTSAAIVYPVTITCYPDSSDVVYYGYYEESP